MSNFDNNNLFKFDPQTQFYNIKYNNNVLYSKTPISKFPEYNDFPQDFLLRNIKTIKDELNLNKYRSDDFKKIHDGLHVLFTGCSYTYGTGLEKNETWAYKTYKLISKNNKISGYFNLGMPASSIINEIIDLFKYFNSYGNPDIIFFNMPELNRFYGFNNKDKKFVDSWYNDEALHFLFLISFQYYFMLYQYCKSNNIKLFSFSWYNIEEPLNQHFELSQINLFNTFYNTNFEDIKIFVKEYKKKYPNAPYLELSRDKHHRGIAYHEYWANFIYNKYLDSI
jgi:hypothetical protein